MPLFGKRRAEFSSEVDSYVVDLLRAQLLDGASVITLSITNSLAKEISQTVLDSVVDVVPNDLSVKVYNQFNAKLYPELKALTDKAMDTSDQRIESDLDQILGACCVDLGLRALLHFSGRIAARVADAVAFEWMIEKRTGLLQEEIEKIKADLIKTWEEELQRRRAERALKRRQEEEEEWKKIRSMDPSQRALEIFEIAETLKSMKDKPWATKVSEEQEAAKKRRDEEEAQALKQDEEDDRKARQQAQEDAEKKVIDEKLNKWVSKLITLITVSGDTWVKEVSGNSNEQSEFEASLLALGKEVVIAAQNDGDLEGVFQVIQGQEIGKATRELISSVANWIRSFSWG